MATPFHPDELAAQRLAGGGRGGAGIRDSMTAQHRSFFGSLRYLAVAAVGDDGWPAATLLTGEPGFASAPDPTTLRIALPPGSPDPALGAFAPGQEIGILGIDFATRRRNRANGRVAGHDGRVLTVAVRQSFGNCPQYIQRRAVRPVLRIAQPAEFLTELDGRARDLIGRADTFFVASRSRAEHGAWGGADMSHRGGWPGFVRIDGNTLTIPDFPGNRYFNTLGNFLGEPRAALLFLDFDSGDLLQLQGEAAIDWSDAGQRLPGAERSWRFQVTRGWRVGAAIPLGWSFIDLMH